jgi:hypothetical protein
LVVVGCLDYIIISSARGVAESAAMATTIRLLHRGRVGSELDKSGLSFFISPDRVRSCRDDRVWSIPKPVRGRLAWKYLPKARWEIALTELCTEEVGHNSEGVK